MSEINGRNFCQHRLAILAILIDGLHDGIVVVERSDDMTQERQVTTEGLKLIFSGSELHELLQEGIERHRRRAAHWKREQARTPDEQTDDHPLLPDHMCENEAERHDWRAEVLEFIRAHVEPAAVYRLGEADLLFGELLPEKPGHVEQQEYEERTSVGFNLERLTKRLGEVMPIGWGMEQLGASALTPPTEDTAGS